MVAGEGGNGTSSNKEGPKPPFLARGSIGQNTKRVNPTAPCTCSLRNLANWSRGMGGPSLAPLISATAMLCSRRMFSLSILSPFGQLGREWWAGKN